MTEAPAPSSDAPSTTTTSPPTTTGRGFDRRWLVIAAVPVLAYGAGLIALPHPKGVAAEQLAFDRSVISDAVTMTPTTPKKTVGVTLGDAIILRGSELPDVALTRGRRFSVKLHFGVEDVVDGDWQVFLHIDAQGGSYRIHGDHWPVRGQYKTAMWQKGEFVVDSWEGTVPMDAPSGIYDVWAGLYRGDDRLEVTSGAAPKLVDADNRVNVGSITIE